jgi:hypothetical protein
LGAEEERLTIRRVDPASKEYGPFDAEILARVVRPVAAKNDLVEARWFHRSASLSSATMLPRMLLADPEDWTLAEVGELISGKVPEGQRLDYKSELHLDTKTQKAEAAKDVSGMANAQGGWILFGVGEDESGEPLPAEITPLAADGLQTRLENILDSALEPVPRYGMASIRAGEGIILALKVRKARGRPVMVQGYGQNRYFIRSGTRTARWMPARSPGPIRLRSCAASRRSIVCASCRWSRTSPGTWSSRTWPRWWRPPSPASWWPQSKGRRR